MKRIITLLTLIATLGPLAARADFSVSYRGYIGKYYAEMHLTLYDNGKVEGYYQYFNNYKATSSQLRLKGTWHSMNMYGSTAIAMKEYTPKGQVCGTWKVQAESRGGFMQGSFTNSKGCKFTVEMDEY